MLGKIAAPQQEAAFAALTRQYPDKVRRTGLGPKILFKNETITKTKLTALHIVSSQKEEKDGKVTDSSGTLLFLNSSSGHWIALQQREAFQPFPEETDTEKVEANLRVVPFDGVVSEIIFTFGDGTDSLWVQNCFLHGQPHLIQSYIRPFPDLSGRRFKDIFSQKIESRFNTHPSPTRWQPVRPEYTRSIDGSMIHVENGVVEDICFRTRHRYLTFLDLWLMENHPRISKVERDLLVGGNW